jgi:Flp pilus assembly protein TadG
VRGAMSVQFLVILVPVIFGLMGFAIDLGRLYLIRGELNQAASAMALAAAAQMGATQDAMYAAAQSALTGTDGTNGNRFNFGGTPIAFDPTMVTCFPDVTTATANDQTSTTACGLGGAPVIQVTLSAPAPLIFWGLLPGGESRTTTVASYAVAGMSAPLCTGCGVVPFAVQALDTTDTVNWGFAQGSLYTFYYSCTGTPPLAVGGVGAVAYVLLNRVDTSLEESDQLFRQGAQGLNGAPAATPPNACAISGPAGVTPSSCVSIGDIESIPANGVPAACTAATPPIDVINALCGLDMRLEATPPGTCQTNVTNFGALSPLYTQDADPSYILDPTAYQGNGRRIITVSLVNGLATDTTCSAGMTVVAFRQFLIEPNADGSSFNPLDQNGRFVAMYLGTVSPIPQGWFDTRYAQACRDWLPSGTPGPGKVVLHQ